MDIRINLDRLKKDIEELGQIGQDPKGGISRPSFSRADLEARDWLKDKMVWGTFSAVWRELGKRSWQARISTP